jgi:hypothetical protein
VVGRGKGLTTALIEPGVGLEKDFDKWYREEHLSMLSKLSGYRRTTRYHKDDAPHELALHEYDQASVPWGIGAVLGTPWSRKQLGSAKSTQFDTWEYIMEYGPKEEAF